MLLYFCKSFYCLAEWKTAGFSHLPLQLICSNTLSELKHVKKIYLTKMCSWKWKGYFNGFFK